MSGGHPCPCQVETQTPDRFCSVTKSDYLVPSTLQPAPIPHHHRTISFCTPVVDTGGIMEAPMGLSCSTSLQYTAGAAAPDQTSGRLSDSLPVGWTQGAGVEPGLDMTYKSDSVIHQDVCREGHPRGRMCAASRMVAARELEKIIARARPQDRMDKRSTPSGHRGRQLNLENMYSNMAELNLMTADTEQGRKQWVDKFEPYQPRQTRDQFSVYDW
eukprot:TRINITY_DN39030_c0_g1_i1.p1 TRINITY_DN39030_c0_g1~~TRINITY_DN39030_c0_g1_i1.p1  ORF type:complete len:215 (+),score=83.44 TRINITY_DN39030_c0_g1_i1:46-690(+)